MQIERLIEKTGGFGTLLILHVDMANWEDTKRSFELFASEVIMVLSRTDEVRKTYASIGDP